jgi:transposase
MPRQRRKQIKLTNRRRRRLAKRADRRRCGTRYGKEFRDDCLKLIRAGMTKVAIKEKYDVSEMTLGRWQEKYGLPKIEDPNGMQSDSARSAHPTSSAGEHTPVEQTSRAPHDNIAGLSQEEVDEILKLKKERFTMGPAQIRAQLKRFRGWRLSIKAIAQVLKAHGYLVEHKK